MELEPQEMRRRSRTQLNRTGRAVLTAGIVLAWAAASVAHDPGASTPDIQINVDGGNTLVANYTFDTSPIVRVFDTGFAGSGESDIGVIDGKISQVCLAHSGGVEFDVSAGTKELNLACPG